MKICVVSNGSFGTSLATVLCENQHDVTLWGRDEKYVAEMRQTRINSRYLKGCKLPDNLTLSSDFAVASQDCELFLVATPAQFIRSSLEKSPLSN